jgi:hypothetical protein
VSSEYEVTEEALARAFFEAAERFRRRSLERDPEAAYRALFESLAWVVSIDERLGFPDFPELRGLRAVRNRLHHQWADALVLVEGAAFPISFPAAFFEYEWRALDQLPRGRNSRHDSCYRDRLEGRPVRLTLDAVMAFISRAVGLQVSDQH